MDAGMPTESTVHIIDPDVGTAKRLEVLLGEIAARTLHYASVAAFQACAPHPRPGCVVMELSLLDECALSFIQETSHSHSGIPIVVLTGGASVRKAVDAMVAGAMFVLEKPGDDAALIAQVLRALQHDADSLKERAEVKRITERLQKLSAREREVAGLILQGLETKVIAGRLGISPKTVEYHRAQIFNKMEVSNSVQLTVALTRCEPRQGLSSATGIGKG